VPSTSSERTVLPCPAALGAEKPGSSASRISAFEAPRVSAVAAQPEPRTTATSCASTPVRRRISAAASSGVLIAHLRSAYRGVVVTHFAAFLGIAALLIVTPGPDTALTVRNALLGSRRAGVFTAFGVVAGQATWALATSAGVAALLRASEPAFTALKIVGATYLVYLGGRALLAAVGRGRGHGILRAVAPGGSGVAPPVAFRQGLLSNLGNPKMAVFFTSLLPQFVPAGGDSFIGLLVLGITFCALTLAWLSAYAVAVAKAGDVLLRPRVRRILDAVTGAVLTALGLRLATERR
jgi:threonine/homoserine/homoserine lactone efflux protein